MTNQSEPDRHWFVIVHIPPFGQLIMTVDNTSLMHYDQPYAKLRHIHHQPNGRNDPIRIFGESYRMVSLARKKRFPSERLAEPNLPVRVAWERYRRDKP